MFAEIIFTKHSKALDQKYTYHIPKDISVSKGDKVVVPFGNGNVFLEGYVIDFKTECVFKTKDILYVSKNLSLTDLEIDLIYYLKNNCLCTYSEALNLMIPSNTKLKISYEYKTNEEIDIDSLSDKELKKLLRNKIIYKEYSFKEDLKIKKTKYIYKNSSITLEEAIGELSKNAKKMKEVLAFIFSVEYSEYSYLRKKFNITISTLDKLKEKGFIEMIEKEDFRLPAVLKEQSNKKIYSLSKEQSEIYEDILCSTHDKFLIHGVTGSGKTEIYIALAKEYLKKEKQVLILVPEISLTPQLVSKMLKHFKEKIGVLHSKISPGEKYDQYRKMKEGDIKVVIGARSAIFAPFTDLGLIIIDEEHESSYKSEMSPKYHTISIAEYIISKTGGKLVLGSATPSVNTYKRALLEEYKLYYLDKRFNDFNLDVHLVDMKEELLKGNRGIFSDFMLEKIEEKLFKKEQIILFYNRKGYSSFVNCRECGYVVKCPHCDISMTYYKNTNKLKCSYCDYMRAVPKVCPECESMYFKHFGLGTEHIEEELRRFFPEARVLRMDRESTRHKEAVSKIIRKVEDKEVDILIGTQMVTKGLDFENVTLVGAISADLSLNFPDYRSNERTFQLLTQVAGRAGRGEKKGEVIIQTYNPEHFSITSSVKGDYKAFYDIEIKNREMFYYPPECEIVNILLQAENEERLIKSIQHLYQQLRSILDKKQIEYDIKDPSPALLTRIKNRYRWQIILKFDKIDREMVKNIIKYVCIDKKDKVVYSDVNIGIDFNPLSLV